MSDLRDLRIVLGVPALAMFVFLTLGGLGMTGVSVAVGLGLAFFLTDLFYTLVEPSGGLTLARLVADLVGTLAVLICVGFIASALPSGISTPSVALLSLAAWISVTIAAGKRHMSSQLLRLRPVGIPGRDALYLVMAAVLLVAAGAIARISAVPRPMAPIVQLWIIKTDDIVVGARNAGGPEIDVTLIAQDGIDEVARKELHLVPGQDLITTIDRSRLSPLAERITAELVGPDGAVIRRVFATIGPHLGAIEEDIPN